MTRGLRNNNPLNIRKVPGTHWRGEVLPQRGSGEGAGDRLFVQFESLEYGIRAAFCILDTYRRKYQDVCVEDIIARWAPASENNTEKYIKNVCLWTGLGGLQRLTEEDWPKLVLAMARQECGALLSEDVVQKGFHLYRESVNRNL